MTHTNPPDFRLDNLNSALFADDTTVLHPFVFTAVTLEIFNRTEDFGTKQSVPFRLERPIVDGLRFFDFPERPASDLLRGGQFYL